MAGIKDKIEYLLKHNAFIQKTYVVVMSSVFKTLGLFVATDKHTILFTAQGGRRFNDSPKAIFDYLRKDPKFKNYKFIWAFENPDDFRYVDAQRIPINSLKYFTTALKAGYWITNVNMERGLKFKKRATRYLNTWHGIPLNHVGNACPGRKDYDSSNVDVFCCAGEYERNIFIHDLGALPNNMLDSGLPRNDELYNISQERIENVRIALGIPLGKKVILYAPTWRDSTDGGKSYVMRPPIDMKKWEKYLNDEYVLLLRMHAFTTGILGIEFNEFVRDASDYPNINDLFAVADILISDYSACITDYSILERPIISFAYDYDEYASNRGFYFDLPTGLPGGICRTEDEVLNRIKNLEYDKECAYAREIKSMFNEYGGCATKLCVDKLFEK